MSLNGGGRRDAPPLRPAPLLPLSTALLFLLPLLVACPHRPPPIDFGTHGRIEDPALLLSALEARRSAVHAIAGEAKASITSPDGSGSLTQNIVAEAPDKLRLESVSFFGSLVAVLTSDGGVARLYDVEQDRFYEGPATAENVSRLLPVRLEPEELVSLLLGVPPLLEDAEPEALVVDDVAGGYVLTLRRGADVQRVLVDPKTLRPLGVETPARGLRSGWRVTFSGHEGPMDLPDKVRLVRDDGTASVELDWREREVDPPLEPDVFVQEVPEGTGVTRL